MSQRRDLPTKSVPTPDLLERVLAAALGEAEACGVRVSVALLDDGGHLLRFVRMEGVHAGTVEVALAKARAAVLFRKPTRVFASALADGEHALLGIPGLIALPGGIPLVADGGLLGAIGVSGAAPAIDERIAAAGADSLST